MKVELLQPDVPLTGRTLSSETPDAGAFGRAVDAIGTVLAGAAHAEDSFAAGTGSLNDAIYERARADVALSIATAAAQRSAQALQSILNMQI